MFVQVLLIILLNGAWFMPQHPFPDPGPGGEEPDGSALPPAAEGDGPEGVWEDWDGPAGQGLYICLPPEQLTLAGFAQGGEADTMAPGPLLATIVDTVTGEDGQGLGGCSDDQLLGIISAAQRQQSRDEWIMMAAITEFARRAGTGVEGEFAADELAFELHMTQPSAAGQMDYASTVAARLPETFAALRAGLIRSFQLRIIEEETRYLSDADAAAADAALAATAPGMTFGQTRSAARRLALGLDPELARKRKEAARREAHVRRFQEASGNAGMVARELPADEVLASWQHVEQRALDLRAAGIPGTLQELRVRAYLDLLQERDSRTTSGTEARTSPSGPGQPPPGGRGPAPNPSPAPGPSLAAQVTITIPFQTYQGRSETPGQADGFGVLDGDDARDVAAAAARHPRSRWCVTALNPDGTAAAHACLPGGRAPPEMSILNIPLTPVTRGPCDHAHAEVGYHPSRKLAHLIRARNGRCTAPGCGRPAARCDLDHTHPWDQGGPTCECNLAPLCRHHHRCKQAEGWQLEQPQPGVLAWRTPSGRTYTTTPTKYAV
jgi:Domain of unknown function (DUF222)